MTRLRPLMYHACCIDFSKEDEAGGLEKMRRLFCALAIAVCLALAPATRAEAAKPLEIYFIDVEGGQATLIVDPHGPSLLVDTGWSGFDRRNATRLLSPPHEPRLNPTTYVLF